jgi:hypothetical protein
MGKYNNNTLQFEAEQFNIFQNVFIESDNLYLGGSPSRTPLNKDSLNFSGFIDKFFFIKSDDLLFYKEPLSVGLYSNLTTTIIPGEQYCFETGYFSGSGFLYSGQLNTVLSGYQIVTTGITGYEIINSGSSYFGLTGYENISIGFFTDNCGLAKELFNQVPLSGLITTNVNFNKPLTGFIYSSGFTEVVRSGLLSGESLIWISSTYCTDAPVVLPVDANIVDLNYLPSLSYKQVSLLKEFQSGGYIETFVEPYRNSVLDYNKNLIYDELNQNYFYFEDPILNKALLFANGQILLESGYELTPDGYNVEIFPKLDFLITGNRVETAKLYNNNDYLFYDDIRFNNYFLFTGITNSVISGNFTGSLLVFKNGQKLIETVDYQKNNNQVIFNESVSPTQDIFLLIQYDSNKFTRMLKTGLDSTVNINSNFNHGCSQVYLNGVRQKINNNYIENARFDLISGNFYETQSLDIIYNNTDDFLT